MIVIAMVSILATAITTATVHLRVRCHRCHGTVTVNCHHHMHQVTLQQPFPDSLLADRDSGKLWGHDSFRKVKIHQNNIFTLS
jgi:hypothetical protein